MNSVPNPVGIASDGRSGFFVVVLDDGAVFVTADGGQTWKQGKQIPGTSRGRPPAYG